MHLLRISLATKYRFLFGMAVVLIIGAALAVPWYYMETLVLEQPYREAQSIADSFFRQGLLSARTPGASTGGVHSGKFSLLPELAAIQPEFVDAEAPPDDPRALARRTESDPFLEEALRTLRRNPTSESFYRTSHAPDTGRQFRYAHAVWITRRCLNCHDEGRTARPYRENQLAGLILVDLPAEPSQRASIINRVVVITAGALAGIFAILVFYVITTRFILAPIHELRSVAVRVAEGDLAIRSNVQTGDEFEQLSVNLNQMLERLRVSQEELKKANRLLDEKLEAMAESNVALYEANRLKSEFIATVSHELRTPLTSIIGFAELLRESPPGDGSPAGASPGTAAAAASAAGATSMSAAGGTSISAGSGTSVSAAGTTPLGAAASLAPAAPPAPAAANPDRTRRYAENILISGRILLEIINDLLDLARIEAGKVELRVETFSLAELCTTLADHMRPLADRKSVGLELQLDETLPPLPTDRGKLRQILFNLLSNALKFTPEGGHVILRTQRLDDHFVQLSIEDTGPGIAPDQQQLIFEKFRQIDQSTTREHHGTGLGLAIAKELTTVIGGRIGVNSELGKGATFWLVLPTAAPPTADRPRIAL